ATALIDIHNLSLHDALPIFGIEIVSPCERRRQSRAGVEAICAVTMLRKQGEYVGATRILVLQKPVCQLQQQQWMVTPKRVDRATQRAQFSALNIHLDDVDLRQSFPLNDLIERLCPSYFSVIERSIVHKRAN